MMKSVRKRRGARLGQHFLTGTWAAKRLAESAQAHAEEIILEIGPGKGALTRELLETGARVIAIEKDAALVEELHITFAPEIASNQLILLEDDIRNFEPRSLKLEARGYVLAANIPYYITGEIIRMFLTTEIQPRRMVLLIQKEVADRILARDKKESILSLSVKAYGVPRVVAKVSRGNFSPPPSVDSAILAIENISRDFFNEIDESSFFKIVRAGFSSKRKFLARNLAVSFPLSAVRDAFKQCAIDEKARAEDLPLVTWKRLTKHLSTFRESV